MNAKLIYILLLLLTVAVLINSGCGATRTNAQSRGGEDRNSTVEISDSSTPSSYKPAKRISRDVIGKGESPKIEKTAKTKKR